MVPVRKHKRNLKDLPAGGWIIYILIKCVLKKGGGKVQPRYILYRTGASGRLF